MFQGTSPGRCFKKKNTEKGNRNSAGALLTDLNQFSLWRNFYNVPLRPVSGYTSLCVNFHLDTLCIIDSHTINTLEPADGVVSDILQVSRRKNIYQFLYVCVDIECPSIRLFTTVCVCATEPQMDDTHNSHTCFTSSKSPTGYTVLLPEGFPVKVSLSATVNPSRVPHHQSDRNLCKICKI